MTSRYKIFDVSAGLYMSGKSIWVAFPLLSRVVVWILFPIVLFLVTSYYYFLGSLPDRDMTLDGENLSSRASISRNEQSLPSATVAEEKDAFFALGFLHAQDRLWQMDNHRRMASGRFAELSGPDAIISDTLARTLGFRQQAAEAYKAMAPEARSVLDAYVKGVNSGIDKFAVLPPEFHVKKTTPEPWEAEDTLAILSYTHWVLRSDLNRDLSTAVLLQNMGVDATRAILEDNHAAPQHPLANTGTAYASINNSGDSVLSVDYVAANTVPAFWYLARLVSPKLTIEGASIPGLPFIFSGKNNKISWGVAKAPHLPAAIVLEQVNIANKHQYLRSGEFLTMSLQRENIEATAGENGFNSSVDVLIRHTQEGPILSDLNLADLGAQYSYRREPLDINDAFNRQLAVQQAADWNTFSSALNTGESSAKNTLFSYVFADANGIGAIGPAAKAPSAEAGLLNLPKIGWSEISVQGAENVTRQNELAINGAPNTRMQSEYATYGRVDILQYGRVVLSKTGDVVAAEGETSRAKAKVFSAPLLEKLKSLSFDHAKYAAPLAHLQAWDGVVTNDSVAATIAVTWAYRFHHLLLSDELSALGMPQNHIRLVGRQLETPNFQLLDTVLDSGTNPWCDYKLSAEQENCAQLMSIAFEHALEELRNTLGRNDKRWAWSKVNISQITRRSSFREFDPMFLDQPSQSKSADKLVNRSVDRTDSLGLVSSAPAVLGKMSHGRRASLNDFRRFQQHGSVFKQVVDFSKGGVPKFSLNTGQSGNVLSRHYDDLIENHANGILFDFDVASAAE